jgi:Tfp pilus assembly protein PilF
MSLFKRMFSADPAALVDKADKLFDAGSYGPAKLAYEKALSASAEADRSAIAEKVRRCTDAIARERIEEAKAYLEQGSIELAAQELEGALEVACDERIVEEAQSLLDGLEAKDAQEQATTQELTDEERIALLMGQWTEAQADEYESYGDALLDALLIMHGNEPARALAALEALLESASEPCYLWLEVGRARLLAEDLDGGRAALETFLDALGSEDASELRLTVHLTLARLADDAAEFEQAMQHFERAVSTGPDDYRPYLAMGAFLRDKGHATEALDVLRTSLELSKTSSVDWRLLEELGLASELAGKPDEARSFLEQVIEFFTSRQVMDFPPTTAMTLAKLYESEGSLERAADMYRALSRGSDTDKHALYHYEAARLLGAAGLDDEARRMLTRADALVSEDDASLKDRIAAMLQG